MPEARLDANRRGSGAHLRFGAPFGGHIERRRAAPESKYLGFIPLVSLRDRAEIPRPSFAQGSGGQARLGMTVLQDHGFFLQACTESQMRRARWAQRLFTWKLKIEY